MILPKRTIRVERRNLASGSALLEVTVHWELGGEPQVRYLSLSLEEAAELRELLSELLKA
jgi:hypothetical protein